MKKFIAEVILPALNSSIFGSILLIFLFKAINPGIKIGKPPPPIKIN